MSQTVLSCISSMATRQVLAELAQAFEAASGCVVRIESVGGVDALRRVQAGEAFDAVFLAADAIDKLGQEGRIVAGSKIDLMHSPVAVAVRVGAAPPDIGSEAALRAAVLAADRIGYSTGPSGVALLALFERWGIAPVVRDRLVQARPGVAVGTLVASGEVALGFQQLSELMHQPGITLIGTLPEAVQIVTTFSAGLCAGSTQADAVRRMLVYMAGPQAADAKRRHGMQPA